MQTYTIYMPSTSPIAAVKIGFSWPAFFFGPLWAFNKDLIGLGIGLVILEGLVAAIEQGLTANSPVGLTLAVQVSPLIVQLIMGFEGNRFWRRRLERKGYQAAGLIQASDVAAATRSFRGLEPEVK